jgi:hypothetical protein
MMFERGVLDEEIKIYGQSDYVWSEAVRSWVAMGFGAKDGVLRY